MGVQQSCCSQISQICKVNEEQNQTNDLEVITSRDYKYDSIRRLQTCQDTFKTTQKTHQTKVDWEANYDVSNENQSSNLENAIIPLFIASKKLNQSIVPKRENRFIQDLETAVREKIKEIQEEEKKSLLMIQLQASSIQQSSCQEVGSVMQQSDLLQLPNKSSSQFGATVDKLQSTQIECISVPVRPTNRGILKKTNSARLIEDKPRQLSKKKVHFSNDTRFRSDSSQNLFKWRQIRNI